MDNEAEIGKLIESTPKVAELQAVIDSSSNPERLGKGSTADHRGP
jgi:hypothetical protein